MRKKWEYTVINELLNDKDTMRVRQKLNFFVKTGLLDPELMNSISQDSILNKRSTFIKTD